MSTEGVIEESLPKFELEEKVFYKQKPGTTYKIVNIKPGIPRGTFLYDLDAGNNKVVEKANEEHLKLTKLSKLSKIRKFLSYDTSPNDKKEFNVGDFIKKKYSTNTPYQVIKVYTGTNKYNIKSGALTLLEVDGNEYELLQNQNDLSNTTGGKRKSSKKKRNRKSKRNKKSKTRRRR